jgi:glucose/arabinose dehydrogenase
MKKAALVLCLLLVVFCLGCYVVRPSSGGGQYARATRFVSPSDVALPPGYAIEVVATNLTFPTGVTFDGDGRVYVVKAGYCYGEKWTTPRLLRVERGGALVPIASGNTNGPWNGVVFHDGQFFVAEGGQLGAGKILKVTSDGNISVLVDGLPSYGDHHTDGPLISPDGWLYFGQGTASNSGVIGEDNYKFGWLKRYPRFHDIPGQDITLTGEDFRTRDVLNPDSRAKAITGAFLPFGTPSTRGQVIKGQVKCTGAILRIRPSGGSSSIEPELVAWGLRNPFGMAFSQEGQLFVTDNSYDERGSRPVWGTADVMWQVQPGLWYGWPDFSAGLPVTDKQFHPPGDRHPKFLLARHPNKPPQPVARFGVHSSANGFDFSRNAAFGHVGEAFVALFGDQASVVGKVLNPVGFEVVRVNVATGVIEPFAVNRGKRDAPASRLKTGGLERPVAARFDPSGTALYIVDFGVLNMDKKGSKPRENTGVLWRITKQP